MVVPFLEKKMMVTVPLGSFLLVTCQHLHIIYHLFSVHSGFNIWTTTYPTLPQGLQLAEGGQSLRKGGAPDPQRNDERIFLKRIWCGRKKPEKKSIKPPGFKPLKIGEKEAGSSSNHPSLSCELLVSWRVTIRWNLFSSLFKRHTKKLKVLELVGGFNPFEKYESNWIISPGRDEKKYLKPPPSEWFTATWDFHENHPKKQVVGPSPAVSLKKLFGGRPWNGLGGPVNSSSVSKCPMCPIFFRNPGSWTRSFSIQNIIGLKQTCANFTYPLVN